MTTTKHTTDAAHTPAAKRAARAEHDNDEQATPTPKQSTDARTGGRLDNDAGSVDGKTPAEGHTTPETTTTQQPAATMPSEQRVDPLQVFVKSPDPTVTLNQDPKFNNPKIDESKP